MDQTDVLEGKAARLSDFLKSVANSDKHVSVGCGKNVLHVYTKRKFNFPVPDTWEGVEVFHHKSGRAKAGIGFRRLVDAQL